MHKETLVMDMRANHRANAGFTLTELMVAVSIIAIGASIAAPSIANSMEERRMSQASLDLVRLARRARLESMGTGRAWLLRYNIDGSPNGLGQFRLFRGVASRCNANDWNVLTAGPTCGQVNSRCVDELAMADNRYSSSSSNITVQPTIGGSVDICYQSTGSVLFRAGPAVGAGAFSANNTIGGAFVFEFVRRETASGNIEVGVRRQVVLSLSGDARVLK